MSSLLHKICGWSVWEVVAWWPRTASLHPLVLQDCGQVHPRTSSQEAYWHGLLCSYQQCVCHGYECHLEKADRNDDIKKMVKQASKGKLTGIPCYTEDQVVSCNFNRNTYPSIFDGGTGSASSVNFVKVIPWNENKYGWSNRAVDIIDSKE